MHYIFSVINPHLNLALYQLHIHLTLYRGVQSSGCDACIIYILKMKVFLRLFSLILYVVTFLCPSHCYLNFLLFYPPFILSHPCGICHHHSYMFLALLLISTLFMGHLLQFDEPFSKRYSWHFYDLLSPVRLCRCTINSQ